MIFADPPARSDSQKVLYFFGFCLDGGGKSGIIDLTLSKILLSTWRELRFVRRRTWLDPSKESGFSNAAAI